MLYAQWPSAAAMGYRAMYVAQGDPWYEPADRISLLRWEGDGTVVVAPDHPSWFAGLWQR